MDIPTWVIVVVLIILSPWIVGGLITIGVALFAALAGLLVVVLKVLEPVERRYYATEFGRARRRKRLQRRNAKRIAKRNARRGR